MNRTRYAIVGLGSRSGMFTDAIRGSYQERCELVALCDTNQTRMNYWNRRWGGTPVPTFKAADFERMIRERDREWLEAREESNLQERWEKKYSEEHSAWQA